MNNKIKSFLYKSNISLYTYTTKFINYLMAKYRKALVYVLDRLDHDQLIKDSTPTNDQIPKKPKKIKVLDINVTMSLGLFIRMLTNQLLPPSKIVGMHYTLHNKPFFYTPEKMSTVYVDKLLESVGKHYQHVTEIATSDVVYNSQQYYVDFITNLTSPIVLEFKALTEDEYVKIVNILHTIDHWDAKRLAAALGENISTFSKKSKKEYEKFTKLLYDNNMKNVWKELEKI